MSKIIEDVDSCSCPNCKAELLVHTKCDVEKEVITAELQEIVIAYDEDRIE